MKDPILVLGSINMDVVFRIDQCPKGGETRIGDTYSYLPGGKGGNTAVAAARLNAPVAFAGCIGNDANGQTLRKSLQTEDIDDTFLQNTSEPTGLAAIVVENDGQNRILVYPGANRSITIEQLENVFAHQWSAVMMQLEIPQEIVLKAAEMAHERGIPVVLDAGPAQEFPLERCRGLWILSPNETETYALSGVQVTDSKTAEKAARQLFEKCGAEHIVLKLGARGAYHYSRGSREVGEWHDGYTVTAVDTTAAGDAFTAALTVYVLEHGWDGAVDYANAVGALTVMREGAQPSLPSEAEVLGFMEHSGG